MPAALLLSGTYEAPVVQLRINESELIKGLQERCEIKFKLLYKMYAPALLGIILRIVKSETAAEDVLQETFVKIWNSIEGYDSSRGRLFTWMAATARNKAIDLLRSRAETNARKNQDIEDLLFEVEKTRVIAINPETIGVSKLTSNLPPQEMKLLDLIYFKGFTHMEAAAEMNMPLGTVKTKLRKAITTLRGYF